MKIAASEAVIRIINSASDPCARLLNELVEDVYSTSMFEFATGYLSKKDGDEMAISEKLNPYAKVVINLIDDVSSVPEIATTLKRDYLERIKKISQEEVHKAVGNYLGRVIDSIYGEDEEQRRVDVAKLVLGGRPEIVELTSQERRTVTSLLIDTCRQVYGDAPLSRL